MKTRKAYKYRIYPTKSQIKRLEFTLALCRELYNAALEERCEAYRMCGKSLNYYDQTDQFPAIKAVRPDVAEVHSQVLQDVLKRLDKTFAAFFARVKRGDKPGFPRFKGRNRYNSFTFPQGGWSLKNDRLTLFKIGTIKVKLHRQAIGKVKTVTIRRDGIGWFVCFSVEYEQTIPAHNGGVVGIDVGLENFLNLSNGEQVANPRFYRKSEARLAKVQRKLAKLKHLPRHNKTKVKAKRAVTRAFKKIRNQRLDFAHKLARSLVTAYRSIAVEDLNVKGLASSMLAKSVNDAAWSLFVNLLESKAVEAGSQVVKVDPKGTSQTCPSCGFVRKKELSERWHNCECGASMHRDIAAALVILSRGLSAVGNQPVDAPAARSGE